MTKDGNQYFFQKPVSQVSPGSKERAAFDAATLLLPLEGAFLADLLLDLEDAFRFGDFAMRVMC